MFKNKKTLLAVLFPIQVLLIKILAHYPDFIENYYSNGIYPIISKTLRYILGWIPFSVGDLFYACLNVFIIRWVFKNRRLFYKNPKETFTTIFAFLSVLYFAFHMLWGMNYYRNPLHKTLVLEAEYTTEQLMKVTENLITNVNSIHLKIAPSDSVKAVIPYSRPQIFDKTINGYTQLQHQYPNLNYQPRSIKKSIWSVPLTYSGYSGYLNPFTNEAQVNYLIPKYHFPLVSCHEEAHQIGYAAENETNFIGYLACKENPDVYFNYAGATFAVRYCLREVYRRDENKYEYLLQKLNLGVRKDFQESQNFWSSYQNPMEIVLKYGYDVFLKSNNQQKGIKSYSYVVALIVNYELKENSP
ncbi:MAG: amino acid permease [Kordia sp.]|nr:MAG: amino acid permease [Kordia sp.]